MISLIPFIEAVEKKNLGMDAVAVFQNEKILGLHRFTDTIEHNVFSIAKSYTSTAIGMAVDDGKLSLEDRPSDFFADMMSGDIDPRWKAVTLEDLLTMRSGHGKQYMMSSERKMLRGETNRFVEKRMMEEWLFYAFSLPFDYEAGEQFSYGNLAPYVAGRMLEKAVGMTICDYLYEKMWRPMGIAKPLWKTDSAGHTFAASDLFLDITDMGALGMMYAQGGVYKGRRYLSESWVEAATSKQTDSVPINPGGPAPDEMCGYGYYFWMSTREGIYRCYGREGQFIIVIPKCSAVIATQAMHSDVQPILDAVWKYILPQIQ